MSEEKVKLDNPENRKSVSLNKYKENKGIYVENSEVETMSEFVERKEFEQFEKRIDDKFNTLDSKIDDLPNRFNDKLQIALNNQMESLRKERKEDKKSIITWTLSGTGVIIALAGFLVKLFF
ncbi:hypothetical protein [Staphylococcus warneri]|uniref:hypothetical protein n=1 Tax=Staphylococcus warneri TaxID=1292 RepID=UPI000DCE9A11|nr:hypothetical protein [Staphylococcus warneri]MCE5011345.1 hypothetical protein [Staphylococcus warneri]RAV25164.1 hypothetical protein DQE84_11195 [Staphylococcus warneri]RXU49965.1 hypothetical protein CWE31_03965 [Staphylococcus warneri]